MQVQKLERWGRENPEAINNLLIRSGQLLRRKTRKSIQPKESETHVITFPRALFVCLVCLSFLAGLAGKTHDLNLSDVILSKKYP